MRLRHKLFLMMLAVFLLLTALGSGIIIRQSFLFAVKTETDRALAEEAIIAASLYQRVKGLDIQPLREEMERQNAFYSAQGVTVALLQDGRTLWGGETEETEILPSRGVRRYMIQNKALRIAQSLDDSLTLLYERDISGLYDNRDRLLSLALAVCLAGSVLILSSAVVIAKVIMRPVDTLRKAAAKIASGKYAVSLPTHGQDETAELARQFETMALAVKAREEELRDQAERRQLFIDSLAHEMRTPLTAVMGYTRYLQSVDANETEKQKALSYIVTEAERLKSLDETLMTLTRMTHDGPELHPVDIPALMEEAAGQAGPAYTEKGVFLKVQAANGAWQSDAALLLLVAGNLLKNALAASSPGMTVILRGTPEGLSVSDTGIGMTQEQIQKACEPFYKADKARTRKAGGAGLGLTLCSRAAELMGTRLLLASSPGGGTTVSLVFDNTVTSV